MAPTINRPRKAFWNIALFRLFCLQVAAIPAAVSSGVVTLTASAQSGGDVCFGDVVQLTCSTRRDLTEYLISSTLWRENANPLLVTADRAPWYSHQTISSSRDRLTINVTSSYFNLSTTYSYQCFYRFPNNTDDNSGVVSFTVGELLKPEATFTVVNSTTALLSASIGEGVCCTSLTILSNVSRNSNDTSTALVEEMSTTSSRVSKAVTLGEEYNYTAEVVFRCLAPAMDQHTRLVSVQGPDSTTPSSPTPPSTLSTGTTEPSTTDTTAAVIAGSSIGGVLVIVIVFIAGYASGVLSHVLCQKMATKKSTAPPSSPPAPSYGHTQGDVGAGPEMTDNPSYQLVERSQDSKQLYQNL